MTYADVGADAWRWVLQQVRYDDDGPVLPETPGGDAPYRDGYHSGLAGLAQALTEVRLSRPPDQADAELADAIRVRLERAATEQTDVSFFDGLASTAGGLVALGADPSPALERALELVADAGWPSDDLGPRYAEGAVCNDLGVGTAGVLLAAVWCGDDALAHRAADLLVAEAEPDVPDGEGRSWRFVPAAFCLDDRAQMPNLSHGTAGMASALAVAGVVLGRDELVALAAAGGRHLVALADPAVDGLAVPVMRPFPDSADVERHFWGWCHGPTGTSLLYAALDVAEVASVAGEAPAHWRSECWRAVLGSGIPERKRPGFWDNDGRCCGSAGVGEAALDAWLMTGDQQLLDLAVRLGDTLLEHAVTDADGTRWRFTEHRNEDPLLPPGTGWFQGAAGIAAYLLRLGRTLDEGRGARTAPRMESWWALPGGVSNLPRRRG